MGIDIQKSYDGFTLVERALDSRSYNVLRELPSPGFWIHASCAKERTPMLDAVDRGDITALQAFKALQDKTKSHSLFPDALKMQALEAALRLHDAELNNKINPAKAARILCYLVEDMKFDVTLRDHDNNTVLHMAAASPDSTLLEHLFFYAQDKPIDLVNSTNDMGQTPMDIAVDKNNPLAVFALSRFDAKFEQMRLNSIVDQINNSDAPLSEAQEYFYTLFHLTLDQREDLAECVHELGPMMHSHTRALAALIDTPPQKWHSHIEAYRLLCNYDEV